MSRLTEVMDMLISVPTWFTMNIRLVVLTVMISLGNALECYRCDNLSNPACNQYFMAYQFEAISCPTKSNGDEPMCGKQQQPPLENGWVGVIRSCYYPGDLEDMNETLGCHHHVIADTNFSAIYCLCDRDLCNDATSPSSYPGLRFAGLNSLRSLLTIVLDLRQILASSLLCPIFLTAIFLIDSKLES